MAVKAAPRDLDEAQLARETQRARVFGIDDAGDALPRAVGARPVQARAQRFLGKPAALEVRAKRPPGLHGAVERRAHVAVEIEEPAFPGKPAGRLLDGCQIAEADVVPQAGIADEAYPRLLAGE